MNKYIMMFVAAIALVSCSDDVLETPSTPVKAGAEVQFGLSLEGTRTIYGAEKNNAFPIYWVDGDKVQIYSPNCPEGRNNAEYSVTPVAGQSYAEKLTKTGSYGVQWGNNDADFYSVYPSSGSSFAKVGNNVTATLNIAATQTPVTNISTRQSADMNNIIMYAKTTGVKNGEPVILQYIPYSTILDFELSIAKNKDEQGNETDYGTVQILSMELEAPVSITGDFTLTFNGDTPVVATKGNNGNKISIEFQNYPVLDKDNITQSVKVALIPRDDVASLTGWKVSLNVKEGNNTTTSTYTKTLTPAEVTDKSDLVPGKIHKIKLPTFSQIDAWTYSLNNWLTSLYDYKNIYLTELSLPGAWCAVHKSGDSYQANNNNIKALWDAGVRAFALECKSTSNALYRATPSQISVSGTSDRTLVDRDASYGGTRINTVIKSIATAIPDDEFGVLVLSYADGGHSQREADHNYFLQGVKAEIDAANVSSDIYSSPVTKNTTVKDVLGKLVIIVNVDYEIAKKSYGNDMNALLSYVPHLNQFTTGMENPYEGYLTTLMYSKMYWKEWADENKKFQITIPGNTEDNLYCCFSSSNRTQKNEGTDTTVPTYNSRQAMLRTMISASKEVSSTGAHNVWFVFNAGGTEAESVSDESADPEAFAKEMNPWLLEVIKLKRRGGVDTNGYLSGTAGTMVNPSASSLGLVFFNQCAGDNDTYHGTDIIKEIIDMNNEFKLQRATPIARSGYDGSLTNGGNAIQ